MNREILFRGKRIDIGMWEYGNLSMRDELGKAKYYIGQNMLGYEVLPETVGQFTGLADRNGRKIFEGDIVKGKGKSKKAFAIEYSQNIAGFVTRGPGAFSCPCMNVGTMKSYEVIGNIHDNPGLVGDTENEIN